MAATRCRSARIGSSVGAALGGIAIAGLLVPPRRRRPPGVERGAPSGVVDLTGVPAAFRRYATAAFGDPVPAWETAVLWGRARVRASRGPWVHARAATYHQLGEAFVGDFPLTWFGVGVSGGRDANVDGHGVSSFFGRRGPDAPELDRSSNTFLWLEAGLFPASWHHRGVRLEEVDAGTLRLWYPPHDEPITWRVDAGGLPYRLEAIRPKVAGGPGVPQSIELGPWRWFDGVRWFSSATVTWSDEGRPWLRWRIDGVEPGADVDRIIGDARAQVGHAPRGELASAPA
jgi:hypothetical protein